MREATLIGCAELAIISDRIPCIDWCPPQNSQYISIEYLTPTVNDVSVYNCAVGWIFRTNGQLVLRVHWMETSRQKYPSAKHRVKA